MAGSTATSFASAGKVAVWQLATGLVPGAASFSAGGSLSTRVLPCEKAVGRDFATDMLEPLTGDDNSRSRESEQGDE